MKKVFCITGVTGQDGSYTAEILIELGCNVIGLTRNKDKNYKNLKNIITNKNFKLLSSNYSEESLKEIIENNSVTHIINFCGQSYVSKSWEMIEETIISKSLIVSRIINIIRKSKTLIKFLNACSSEIFGETNLKLNEESYFFPCNPYGSAQLLSFSLIKSVREYSKIWASSAILFPHESLRRDDNFLFMRILNQIDKVISNESKYIKIGNDSVIRDWGFAVDYVYYMLIMILSNEPKDLCICTSEGNRVRDFVKSICDEYKIDYDKHIKIEKSLYRNYEPQKIIGNNLKLLETFKNESPLKMRKLIHIIIENRKKLSINNQSLDKITDYLDQKKLLKLKSLMIN